MSGTGAAGISTTKVGRNDACPCGSGKKFKHCCEAKDPRAGTLAGTAQGFAPGRGQKLQALSRAAKRHWEDGNWADANSLYREIVRLCPDSPQAHCDFGVTCLRLGRLAEATASLQRAMELRPGFHSALTHLACALELQGRQPEASLAYRRLSATADNALERRDYSARAMAMEGRLQEAEKELRRLLAVAPQRTSARSLLGSLLSERGLLEEAAQQLTQAVELDPSAFQQLSAVKRMSEADRPLVDRMRVLAERRGLDEMSRVLVHFGLGKAFDDLGDFAEAMRQYQEGNRLRATSARLNRAALIQRYERIIASFTAEALARARQSLPRPAALGVDLPVFIVGMPRSGTTLVEQILSSHPAVAAGGELTFWQDRFKGWQASSIGSVEASALSSAADDYRALLRTFGPEALRVTDKAPFNYELLWLIGLVFPDARVIHCRRQPVDTCLSIFFTNFLGRQDYAWDRGDIAFFYRQYERLMDHWRRVLPAESFTEVDYETLVEVREAETRRLIAFCGLDWDDACLEPERNGRAVKTASVWQARQPVYKTSVERWRRYEPWLGELRELLPAAEAGAA